MAVTRETEGRKLSTTLHTLQFGCLQCCTIISRLTFEDNFVFKLRTYYDWASLKQMQGSVTMISKNQLPYLAYNIHVIQWRSTTGEKRNLTNKTQDTVSHKERKCRGGGVEGVCRIEATPGTNQNLDMRVRSEGKFTREPWNWGKMNTNEKTY